MKTYVVAMALAVLATPAFAQDAALVFTALDADKDGRVSLAEAKKNPVVTQNFAAADKNRDNALSREEFMEAFGK